MELAPQVVRISRNDQRSLRELHGDKRSGRRRNTRNDGDDRQVTLQGVRGNFDDELVQAGGDISTAIDPE